MKLNNIVIDNFRISADSNSGKFAGTGLNYHAHWKVFNQNTNETKYVDAFMLGGTYFIADVRQDYELDEEGNETSVYTEEVTILTFDTNPFTIREAEEVKILNLDNLD